MTAMPAHQTTERMFSAIAARYDRCNRLCSLGIDRYWRRRLVEAMELADGQTVLDVGCGTGDMVFAVLSQLAGCRLVGIDSSEAMLQIAQEKTILWSARRGLSPMICWRYADATALPFGAETFNAAVSAFCLRNLPNRMAALTEIWRVLKPKGKLGICEFWLPEKRVWQRVYLWYLSVWMPLIGKMVAGGSEPLRYLADSVIQWHRNVRLEDELDQAGFKVVRRFCLTGSIVQIFVAVKP